MSLANLDLSTFKLDEVRASYERDLHRSDPIKWIADRLGETTWSKQREILRSICDNRRTAVRSCHNIGKSFVAARAAAWWIDTHPLGSAFVITTAPTGRQVRAILWKEIGRAHARGKLHGWCNQTEWWITMPEGNNEMVAFGQKPADMDPGAFQGIHAPYVLIIFDEACGIVEPIWIAADTLGSNEDSHYLAIGNPDDPDTEFKVVCDPNSGWNVIGVSAFDTPNFTGEKVDKILTDSLISPIWVAEKLIKWGESSPTYISKILGEFPDTTIDGLIPLRWIREAQQRTLTPGDPTELGVDVGAGGDKSVIALRRGDVVRIIREDTNPDTMQTCGNVVAEVRKYSASSAKIDEIGIGKGVIDRASEIDDLPKGVMVGVHVGFAPTSKKGELLSYINLRAEAYWALRERFQSGNIDLDPNDEDLAAQLIALKYKRTSAGKIQIESKDDMKRRGISSPDKADAIMLAMLDMPQKVHKATWGRK